MYLADGRIIRVRGLQLYIISVLLGSKSIKMFTCNFNTRFTSYLFFVTPRIVPDINIIFLCIWTYTFVIWNSESFTNVNFLLHQRVNQFKLIFRRANELCPIIKQVSRLSTLALSGVAMWNPQFGDPTAGEWGGWGCGWVGAGGGAGHEEAEVAWPGEHFNYDTMLTCTKLLFAAAVVVIVIVAHWTAIQAAGEVDKKVVGLLGGFRVWWWRWFDTCLLDLINKMAF